MVDPLERALRLSIVFIGKNTMHRVAPVKGERGLKTIATASLV